LLKHALFRAWADVEEEALRAVCQKCTRFYAYRPEDYVFLPGVEAEGAFFVVTGALQYHWMGNSSIRHVEAEETTEIVHKGAVLCEAALWMHWFHVGVLESCVGTQLLHISAISLLKVLQTHPLVAKFTQQYGRAFFERTIGAKPPYASWPTDLRVQGTEASDLMSDELSKKLLQELSGSITDEQMTALQKELDAEKCAIVRNDVGEIERVVALVVLRLTWPETEEILVQVADWEPGRSVKPTCTLPGCKRQRGEAPESALQRLMTKEMQPFTNLINFMWSLEENLDVQESARFGVRTRYVRTVQLGNLLPAAEQPELPVAPYRSVIPEAESRPSMTIVKTRSASSFSDFDWKEFLLKDILMVNNGDVIRLYSWLAISDFDHLSSPAGKDDLKAWIGELALDGVEPDLVVPV